MRQARMTKLLVGLVLSTSLMLCGTASASEGLELALGPTLDIPNGRNITVAGVQYKAYTAEEYKQVLQIWNNYLALHDQAMVQLDLNRIDDERLALTKQSYDICTIQSQAYKQSLSQAEKIWKATANELDAERSRSSTIAWVLGTLAIAEATVIAGLGIYTGLH